MHNFEMLFCIDYKFYLVSCRECLFTSHHGTYELPKFIIESLYKQIKIIPVYELSMERLGKDFRDLRRKKINLHYPYLQVHFLCDNSRSSEVEAICSTVKYNHAVVKNLEFDKEYYEAMKYLEIYTGLQSICRDLHTYNSINSLDDIEIMRTIPILIKTIEKNKTNDAS